MELGSPGVIALFLMATLASGCIAGVTFDPVGAAASVEGEWLVDGGPPDEDACARLGASYVRVRFYEESRTVDHPDLVFPCAAGNFDTRPARVVAAGRWTMALVAIDAEGNELARGASETIGTLDARGHIQLPLVDFPGS